MLNYFCFRQKKVKTHSNNYELEWEWMGQLSLIDSLIACLATQQILQGGMTSSPTCQKRESPGSRLVRHAT